MIRNSIMSFTLNFKTCDTDFSLIVEKSLLLRMDYFKSMFEICLEEQEINIDISHISFPNIETYVKTLFNNKPTDFVPDLLILIELSSFFGYQEYLDLINKVIQKCEITDDFLTNINTYYQIFHNTDNLERFYQICKMINKTDIVLNINEIPLLQYYDICTHLNTKSQTVFKFNDYQYLLSYQPSSFAYHKYVIKDKPVANPTILNFTEEFRVRTNNIFADLDWANIVIAGGFIFSILNNTVTNDIDIFIYSSEEQVRKEKWEYLLKYFSNYNAVYHENNAVVSIKIPDLSYPIQIIMMDVDHPNEIIDDFDLNYVKAHYNGHNVYADIGFLCAIKHQLAIIDVYNVNTDRIDTRIYKTINKGLNLMINKDCQSTLITDNIIDVSFYQQQNKEEYYFSDYTCLEWKNNLISFIAYRSDRNAYHQFLTNDDNLILKKTPFIISYAGGPEIYDFYNQDNRQVNVYIDVKYTAFKIFRIADNGVIFLRLEQSCLDLLTQLKNRYNVSNFLINGEFKIKLDYINTNHKKYFDKIADYFYNLKRLSINDYCEDQYMKIICNLQFIHIGHDGLIPKITVSKLRFLK